MPPSACPQQGLILLLWSVAFLLTRLPPWICCWLHNALVVFSASFTNEYTLCPRNVHMGGLLVGRIQPWVPQTPLLLFSLYKALPEYSVRLEKFGHLPKFLICCSLLVLTFSSWQLFQNLFSSTLLHQNGKYKPHLYIFVFISSFNKRVCVFKGYAAPHVGTFTSV